MTKKQYVAAIWTYVDRRREIREDIMKKYSWKGNTTKAPLEFHVRVAQIDSKLAVWRKAVRRIDSRTKQVRDLVDRLESYLGESVKQEGPTPRKNPKSIHGLLFKYGMEHGIQGAQLAHQIGRDNKCDKNRVGSEIRRNFTRSFAAVPENRELYKRFCIYMKEVE